MLVQLMLVQQATSLLTLSINSLFHPLVEFVQGGLVLSLTETSAISNYKRGILMSNFINRS
jgi:hypothetical protein